MGGDTCAHMHSIESWPNHLCSRESLESEDRGGKEARGARLISRIKIKNEKDGERKKQHIGSGEEGLGICLGDCLYY
jgi:hypothetical protein